jgi:hypothetical protein
MNQIKVSYSNRSDCEDMLQSMLKIILIYTQVLQDLNNSKNLPPLNLNITSNSARLFTQVFAKKAELCSLPLAQFETAFNETYQQFINLQKEIKKECQAKCR